VTIAKDFSDNHHCLHKRDLLGKMELRGSLEKVDRLVLQVTKARLGMPVTEECQVCRDLPDLLVAKAQEDLLVSEFSDFMVTKVEIHLLTCTGKIGNPGKDGKEGAQGLPGPQGEQV
jgi:hypothetical protein